MNTCSICKHKNRKKIEAAIARGEPLRDIARQFKAGKDAIGRHRSCVVEVIEKAEVKQFASTIATVREVLESLTADVRSDLTDLFGDDGQFDLADIKHRGLGRMLKSLTFKRELTGPKDNQTPVDVVKVETYSRQDAAKSLLNAYTKLEIAKLMNEGLLHTERERTDRVVAILDQARARRDQETPAGLSTT